MERVSLSRASVPVQTPRLVVERRRRMVEIVHLRGSTVRDISDTLARAGYVNPETNRPWGKSTIQRDVDALERHYREHTAALRDDAVAFIAAQLDYLYREAVRDEAWRVACSVLVAKAQLLGLYPNRNTRVRVSQSFEVLSAEPDDTAIQAAINAYLMTPTPNPADSQ